jgi:hypothetical protein
MVCSQRSKRKEKSNGTHSYCDYFAFDLRRRRFLLEQAWPLGARKDWSGEKKRAALTDTAEDMTIIVREMTNRDLRRNSGSREEP